MKDNTTCIRLRFSPEEIQQLETIRDWLGVRSVSAAAARLVQWNAAAVVAALSTHPVTPLEKAFNGLVDDVVRAAERAAIKERVCGAAASRP